MAFVAEDGTGLATANAYVTLAFANTHHEDRGRDDWTSASDDDKQKALIRATDYIDQRFGRKFRGQRSNSDQALEWPRIDAFDNDDFLLQGVPTQLQKACAEYALISLRQGELAPNPPLPVPDQAVADGSSTTTAAAAGEVVREKIGPLETEYRSVAETKATVNDQRAPQASLISDTFLPEYPVADLWLEELVTSSQSRALARA